MTPVLIDASVEDPLSIPPSLIRVAADDPSGPPHLSYSRISRYLLCPEQYRLYYLVGLRPRVPSASLEFGKIVHRAIAAYFAEGKYAPQVFRDMWMACKDVELTYVYRESWDRLYERGQLLLEQFVQNELPRLTNVRASEQSFELCISDIDVPFVGIIDLDCNLDGTPTVIDFKTSGASYQEHEVALSDQLTAYQLAKPGVQQCALCVFVKTKEPRIEWYVSSRSGAHFREFLAKARMIGEDIAAKRFYKRPGKHCAYCDYLGICLGNQEVQASLGQVA